MDEEIDDRLMMQIEQTRADRLRALLAMQAVASVTGVPAAAIGSKRRLGREVRRARSLALYLCHTEYGWPLHRVGAAFDRDRTTVGVACRDVEDWRDDPVLDALLDRLGRGLVQITACGVAA